VLAIFLKEVPLNAYSTLAVARMLGLGPHRLYAAISRQQLKAPMVGPGQSFLWSVSDVHAASRFFRDGKDASDLLAAPQTENAASPMVAVA
jgi:hypothetical protein